MKHFCYEMTHDVYLKACQPIRKKEDIIRLLFYTIKIMISTPAKTDDTVDNSRKIILHIDKMSRILFLVDDKIFSFQFPFVVSEDKERETLKVQIHGITIDSLISSMVLSIVLDSAMFDTSLSNMDEFVLKHLIENEWDSIDLDDACKIVKHLVLFEPGYLRYDHDVEHQNGTLHPEHHLDLFYSSNNEVKIGLDGNISSSWLIDFMDVRTDCTFIK